MTLSTLVNLASSSSPCRLTQASLEASILHATHWLPSQGPISVFVHHNTLHAFEELPFEEAVVRGGQLYHCEPYLSEERYRAEAAAGRIRTSDLQAVLLDDLDEHAGIWVANLGTRYALRLAMLQFPLPSAPDAELQWLIAETQALEKFREEVEPAQRQQFIAGTRQWLQRQLSDQPTASLGHGLEMLSELANDHSLAACNSWTERQWESFVLRFLWQVCRRGVEQAELVVGAANRSPAAANYIRPRDALQLKTGRDSDRLVDDCLIRFCAAFLDQGFADWELPERESGFFNCFATLFSCSAVAVAPWQRGLRTELKELLTNKTTPLASIERSLAEFGVGPDEQDDFILHTLLALRGWAGLIWQMETNSPWTPRPAPPETLHGYLAIRLILERHALQALALEEYGCGPSESLATIRRLQEHYTRTRGAGWHASSLEQRTFKLFQLSQVRMWTPHELATLVPQQWRQLIDEVDAFDSLQRRRVFHLAYERKYRIEALDALVNHARLRHARFGHARLGHARFGQSTSGQDAAQDRQEAPKTPAFQVVCCIDDREESFRRHLEECDPECETLGAAGFFAVAMYYQGAAEAHYRPLCPIIITPQHYVREEPVFSATDVNAKRTQRRKLVGRLTHEVHARSRTLLGGVLTGVFGSLATFPLVARILAPRLTAQLRSQFGSLVQPPATELHIERVTEQPGKDFDSLGYSIPEMASIVVRILQDLGLVENFAPIVLFVGHGSSSLNNPHESAYNCGACSGGRGGANARSFALMANEPRVRKLVAEAGIAIPDEVRFVGAYHNTCTDMMEYYDLDQLPRSHRPLFRRIESSIDEARARNAHERARRFESAGLQLSSAEALWHVEERAEDLSQARPEYNHATNAMCFVGRRKWSRGLFLDRRAFLTSYDPTIDDAQSSILTRILGAAMPVCAGISLEYFFSTVDNEGYGCGSKLPHNIASLAGVMTGAASDIRPGLSAQMVEIHEPMRILFVVETTVERMLRIMDTQAVIGRLVRNQWIQLALLDAEQNQLVHYVDGRFVPYQPESSSIATAATSLEWYRGRRGHLGFASLGADLRTKAGVETTRPTVERGGRV